MDDLEQLAALAEEDDLPPRRSLGWLVPAVVLVLAGGLLWDQRADLAYVLSSPAPLELGGLEGYHVDRAVPGRFARITAKLGPEVNHYHYGFYERELIPLQGVPVILDRRWTPPREKLVTVEGRLEPETYEPRFDKVIRAFLERDELVAPGPSAGTAHVWILTQDLRPWHASWLAAWLALLAALLIFNAAWLVRRLAT